MSAKTTTSRLDRLFILLENGTTTVTRNAAAKQLGDVQKAHPHDLNNLLAKLLPYVNHKEWETRIAAADALSAIVSQVPVFNPTPTVDVKDDPDEVASYLSFAKVDILKVMDKSQLLLSSSGTQFDDMEKELAGLDAQERVARQRKMLEKRLGLTMGSQNLGIQSSDLFKDNDLNTVPSPQDVNGGMKNNKKIIKKECIEVVAELSEGMSARERNRAKRRAKIAAKQKNKEIKQSNEKDDGPAKKKMKTESSPAEINMTNIPDHSADPTEWQEWPLQWFCEELLNLLFSANWESRHGACLALRNITKIQGAAVGKISGSSENKNIIRQQQWLEDIAVRVMCVMVLDRFADFVGDQVVAPVRESCAQTLGVLTTHCQLTIVKDICSVLVRLTHVHMWEVKHAGLLGIKYIIAARQDLCERLISEALPSLQAGLCDKDSDVRSVSAEAILPAAVMIASQPSQLDELSQILCNSLRDLDDLSTSAQPILTLLSTLLKLTNGRNNRILSNFSVIVPQLWLFLHHASSIVRKAALATLNILLKSQLDQEMVTFISTCVHEGMWNVFQCCILEANADIQLLAVQVWESLCRVCPPAHLLTATRSSFIVWTQIIQQPDSLPYHPHLLVKHPRNSLDGDEDTGLRYIGGNVTHKHVDCTRNECVLRTRKHAARMLSMLYALNQSEESINQCMLGFIQSRVAMQRTVAFLILMEAWKDYECSPDVHELVLRSLQEDLYFNELTVIFTNMQAEVQSLLTAASKIVSIQDISLQQVYSVEEATNVQHTIHTRIQQHGSKELIDQSLRLCNICDQAQREHTQLQSTVRVYATRCVLAAIKRAMDSTRNTVSLPQKLNPIIRPLMDALKRETNAVIRDDIATAISHLMGVCATRQPCPNSKLIKNLCQSLKSSSASFPDHEKPLTGFVDEVLSATKCDRHGHSFVLTLLHRQRMTYLQHASKNKRNQQQASDVEKEDEQSNIAKIGAELCLQKICSNFASRTFVVLPQLWNVISQPLSTVEADVTDKMLAMVTLQAIAPAITKELFNDNISHIITHLQTLIWHDNSAIRFVCARCISVLAKRFTVTLMAIVMQQMLACLDSSNDFKRLGTIELIANMISELETDIVPYTVLLVVPLLGRMSDNHHHVRLLATQCFAALIQYMPVESSIVDPIGMPEELIAQKQTERRFLEQLFNSKTLDDYEIPVKINATLRPYQMEGIKWLAFLNRYKLHGVLCDDMGLGKTLQSICILAADHYYRNKKYKETKSEDSSPLPSLVVCPPTLTGHWVDEINKFCSRKHLNPMHYAGHPSERNRLQSNIKHHNLVVASYEVVRNDFNFFSELSWNYCILDEGHMIKNGKSKLTKCLKCIRANHRVILTGTPIQNSVLELWSLFDFLMPGFLGSEHEFATRYSKPILASRDAKSSSKEQEEGVMAMEALHRQVLPFMMRRMKEDVLDDLPPKIIQDYYCNLSPLQVRLYEDFAKTRAKEEVESSISEADKDQDRNVKSKHSIHVFQALQYLQKVCNHPYMVLTPTHPEYPAITKELAQSGSSLHDISHSCKLVALKQLLLDCGIGVGSADVVNQHRALIFCQHKSMLDTVERDLLNRHLSTVTFLRLDGSVPANQRHSIVSKFNNDPSIDLLLLTTKVGGLGLNLTGADTVIFIEHDWNPTTDLQAMDRAHRIGQKKVVNVYRLITKNTLEEKILGLQQFKLNIANTVVGAENSSLQSMGTHQLLNLFTIEDKQKKEKKIDGPGKGLRAMMDNLGELWDQTQYDTEYNLDNFMQSLVVNETGRH